MSAPKSFDFKRATVILQDATSVTPLTLTVRFGEGNLSYTEQRPVDVIRNRGKLDTLRDGDEEPVQVNLTAALEAITSSSGDAVTLREALDQTGGASAWVSTAPDCEPYAVNIIATLDYSGCGTMEDEIFTLPDFTWTNRDVSLSDGTITLQGICNVTTIGSVRS